MKKIIKDLKAHKEYAFETVYYQYYKLIYYVAFSMVQETGLAEEIVQDTFIKMIENIHQYKGKGEFKSWLVSITRNLARNELIKRNKFIQRYSYNDEIIDNFQDNTDDLRGLLLEIRKCLNDFETKIVISHVIYGFTFNKTASELNASESVVKKSYYAAIKKLKEYYSREKNE
ncbi:MAG: sigma-70 family RNA polymerase sigma factor [Bacilli bacterium]|nr:sigma-70 family RNA polymerase sigma factor [Bacilli bacterium]MDD4076677.1 sigma-70 family RNA polymerase sigma factor [Bacilli bacterium]MDD4388837.1 sigma-70 family RNA polymerase sigma factor [Bacilli bacterium]